MIRVVHRNNFSGDGVYIGRPAKLGNPFIIGKDGSREEVMAKYRVWFIVQYYADEEFYTIIHKLAKRAKEGELIFICWCAPEPCHGDIIQEFIQYLNEVGREPKWAMA